MSSIAITTLGMFDGPGPNAVVTGGGVIFREDESDPRPNILVKNIEFRESLIKDIKEDFIIVKNIK